MPAASAPASDFVVGFTKDEPIKAMPVAAATGACLIALVRMMIRSRN